MRSRNLWLLTSVSAAAFLLQAGLPTIARADTLSGQVSSAEESTMEGVIVSAKKEGSTITVIGRQRRQGPFQLS